MKSNSLSELPMFRRKTKPPVTVVAAEQPAKNVLLPVEAVISMGGWYPRTSLHLQEVYAFLSEYLAAGSKNDSTELSLDLDITSLTKQAGYLEYVRAVTAKGLEIRYYEDGLYVLDITSHDPKRAQQQLLNYNQQVWQPALQALFASGAPLPERPPQSAAGPLIVSLHWPHPGRFEPDIDFGPVISKVSADDLAVFKLTDFTFMVYGQPGSVQVRDLLEMQLFFEQFQQHMNHSLQQYRQVWSETAMIAERPHLKPAQLHKARTVLFQLGKKAAVAEGRLQQSIMALQTRASIAQQLELDQQLLQLFHYRFEVLEDNLRYIEQSWRMARDYISQTDRLVGSLTDRYGLVLGKWTFGLLFLLVISSLVGWLVKDQVITVENNNLMAFMGVLLVGLGLLWLISTLVYQQDFSLKQRSSSKAIKDKSKAKK